MLKNVVILDHEPFSAVKLDHYHITNFLEKGINVEYWSLVDCFKYTRKLQYNYKGSDHFVTYIKNGKDLRSKMRDYNSKDTIFIIEFWLKFSTFFIFKELSNLHIKWVRIDYYGNPLMGLSIVPSMKDSLKDINFGNFFRKVVSFTSMQYYKRRKEIQPHSFFVTGNNSLADKYKDVTVSINYFDVNKFSEIENDTPLYNYKYLVFLDTMLVDHPDIEMYGFKKSLSKENYFKRMNRFFAEIENKTNSKVIIAAHPKSNYTNEFGDRICLSSKTAELVNHSAGVITHGSISVSFALLAEKPVYYIYSSELFVNSEFLKFTYDSMIYAAEQIDAQVFDIDKSENIEFQSHVNKEKYRTVLKKYFISNQNKSNFQLLLENFEKLLHEN